MTGAEIIDLDLDAEPTDFREVFEHGTVAIVEENRFQQFERQPARLQRKIAQGLCQFWIVQPAR